ncbi:MAG: T9SS type A sorting domain-containing protein [Crocinitomicaceae bacterium]
MKRFVSFSILVFSVSTFYAQDYQTIRSTDISYFATPSEDYILASRVDQAEILGTDSVFYSFQTVRSDESLTGSDPCKYYVGDSWLGSRIEIKPSGENIFYNRNNESISIQTEAVVNDTFLVYTYTSGDWIKGTVTSIEAASILGEMDTIKIIELFSNVPLNLSNPRFVLSQEHGIVELFAPYSFPNPYQGAVSLYNGNSFPPDYDGNFELVGSASLNVGIIKPTIGDVHDLDIGDFFQFYHTEQGATGDFTETVVEREILNKFIWNPDSVVYFVRDTTEETYYPPANGQSVTTTSGGNIEQISYQMIAQLQTPFLPEEFDGQNGWSSLFVNDCGMLEELVREQALSWSGTDSCLLVQENEPNLEYRYITGVGALEVNGENTATGEVFFSDVLYFAKDNGQNCGDQVMLTTYEEKQLQQFTIFPNPANEFVVIQYTGEKIGVLEITVFTITGQPIMRETPNTQMLEQGYTVNTDFLESGVYFVEIKNRNNRQTKKLIVQR